MFAAFVIIVIIVIIVISQINSAVKSSIKRSEDEEYRKRWNAEYAARKVKIEQDVVLFKENFNTCFTSAVNNTIAKYIFIDFETTDLPFDYTMPSEAIINSYPFAAQVGCLVFNDAGELIDEYQQTIILPEDAEFHPSASRVNGLSKEICESQGRPIGEFFDFFKKYMYPGLYLVGHNIKFDHFILKLEAKRNKVKLPKFQPFCTMKSIKEDISIRKEYGRGLKNPNLTELVCYAFFDKANVSIQIDPHDAYHDVKLCALSFFKLKLDARCN